MRGRGHGRGKRLGICIFLALFASGLIPAGEPPASSAGSEGPPLARAVSGEAEEPDPEKIQWFREKMGISPKYLEKDEGIMMSWTHFFTMLFLILFFIAAMTALVMRHRRTKQLVNTLLKEESHGPDR